MRPPLSMMPALPAAAGIVVGISLSAAWSAWPICAIGAACAVAGFSLSRHYVAYTALMMAIGSMLWLTSTEPPLDDGYLGRDMGIEGKVLSSDRKDYGYAIVIHVDQINGKPIPRTKCYAQIRDFLPYGVRQDSRVSFRGNISRIPREPDIPGDAYHPAWLLRNGINHQIYYLPPTLTEVSAPTGLDAIACDMHDAMFRGIVNSPIEGNTAAFLMATILGDDYFLSDATADTYRSAGIAHVLALSGMHVATLAMIASVLLFPLRMVRRGHIYGRTALILLAWLYALATGMSPSVVRAAVMLTMLILAEVMQRASSPFNAICIAAIVILAASPAALFSPGFQLSFCAVTSILIFNRMIPQRLLRHRAVSYISSLLLLPIAAMVGTGLLSAYLFHIFPWPFVIGNIAMAFSFPMLLGGGFLLMLSTLMGTNIPLLGQVLDWLLDFTDNVIEWLSMHFAAISMPQFSAWVFVPYALGAAFLALSLYRHHQNQPCRWSIAVCASAMVVTGITAGCIRSEIPATAYLVKGTQPMMLICGHETTEALSLSSAFDNEQMIALSNRRFATTARLHGSDSIVPLRDVIPHASTMAQCQIMLGDKPIRIFDDSIIIVTPERAKYAIVTRQFPYGIGQVYSACHPDTIVLTGDIPVSRRLKLKRECGDTIPCIDLHHHTLCISF